MDKIEASMKNGIEIKELLPGEIAGVSTRYVIVEPGCHTLNSNDNSRHVVFIVKGTGTVSGSGKVFDIDGMAVFIPAFTKPFTVFPVKTMEFLEIAYKVDDKYNISANERNSPYFKEYSKCPTYMEAIKSEKTINRTIIDVNMLPCFCMGSVETYGRDTVQAHSHPMIDQLFYGLPGNSCIVTADSEEFYFGENALLHIPPGSMHGVTVQEGRRLHYLWLDFFKDNDMSYIKESHITEEKGSGI